MSDAKRKRSKGLMPRHLGMRLYIEDGAPTAAAPVAAPAAEPAPSPSAAPAAPAPSAAPVASPAPTPEPTSAPAASPAPTAAPAAAKVEGAPEAYADFTLPEGVQADEATLTGFKTLFKELNLPQDAAQKLVTAQAQNQLESAQKTITGWKDAARADKEFGGDKFDENMAVAKSALEKFGTPELNTWLDKTGLGFNPELIRAFYRAGKAISQDGFVPGRSGAAPAANAQRIYANSAMNP